MKLKRSTKDAITGYLFIMPNLLGFLVFTLFSVVFSLVISFTDWDMVKGLGNFAFIGLSNFVKLFRDKWVIDSLLNNLFFILFIPLQIFIALCVAVIINSKVYFSKAWRTILYMPKITNVVIVTVLWGMLLNPGDGIINNILYSIGIHNPPKWLGSVYWVKPAIVIMYMWSALGYYVILFMSGLQSISKDLYEASEIDGANRIKQFFFITLPLVSPITFFILIMEIIGTFQMWTHIQILSGGGPGTASTLIGYYIYRSAFEYGKMGYASAMSWLLFAIILAVTAIQWQGQKKWVNHMQ